MKKLKKPNYRFYFFIFIVLLAIGLLVKTSGYRLLRVPTRKADGRQLQRLPGRNVGANNYSPLQKGNGSPSLGTPKTKSLTISAAGDVIFDRRVKAAIGANGAGWPFARVGPYLKADLTIVNLESSTATKGVPTAGKDVTFQGTPLGAESLKVAGVDIVSLANNHALDYGLSSLQQTKALLKKQGIAFAGAGENKEQAYRPAVVKVGDLKVGFLSFSDIIPFNSFPTDKSPGIAPARDVRKVASKVKALAGKVHLLIVAFHWGVEYEDRPAAKQKELAVASIDAGADLVLGTHPHVTQGVALYKGRLILYSLGNFVFDHYKARTGESFIFRVDIDYKGNFKFGRIWPVLITDSGQPYVPDAVSGKRILSRVKNLSGKYGEMLKFKGGSLIIEK